ncbi:flagellar basal body P-ring formation chaperone FlgA [Thalassotalea piscium]
MYKVTIFIAITILNMPILAAQSYDGEMIQMLAKSFVEKNTIVPKLGKIKVTPANIDPRIAIKPCQTPLKLNIPENNSSRNVNVKISCEDKNPWVLFLPVRVETQVKVLVANQVISKGSLLDSSNIDLTYIDIYNLRGESLSNIDEILGAKAKRRLAKGKPITPNNFCVICKGDNVEIIAKSNTFMIQTEGMALQDANIGQQIRIKNNRSGRTVVGKVDKNHKVIIN